MSIALDPKSSRRFVTAGDLEPDEKGVVDEAAQTWWKVRDLNERERVDYMNGIAMREGGDGSVELAGTGTRTYIAVKFGLEGYEESHPLKDRQGKVVPFEKDPDGRVADTFLERLDWRDKREIGEDVTRNLTLVGADVEKSEPSPTDS